MTVIGSVGVGPVQSGGARQARGPSGFRLPATRTAATGPAAAVEEVGLAGMLALASLLMFAQASSRIAALLPRLAAPRLPNVHDWCRPGERRDGDLRLLVRADVHLRGQ